MNKWTMISFGLLVGAVIGAGFGAIGLTVGYYFFLELFHPAYLLDGQFGMYVLWSMPCGAVGGLILGALLVPTRRAWPPSAKVSVISPWRGSPTAFVCVRQANFPFQIRRIWA